MVAFYETKLYDFANRNRNKAEWKLPLAWNKPNGWLADEISSLENAYTSYPGTPQHEEGLKKLSPEELYDLATQWVEFMIKLFNRPPASATEKKIQTPKKATKATP